jgi:hypothetical protein
MDVYEMHRPASEGGPGWKGWEIELQSEGHPDRVYSFDERDGIRTAAAAVQAAFDEQRDANRAADSDEIRLLIEEIRIVISAPISGN